MGEMYAPSPGFEHRGPYPGIPGDWSPRTPAGAAPRCPPPRAVRGGYAAELDASQSPICPAGTLLL